MSATAVLDRRASAHARDVASIFLLATGAVAGVIGVLKGLGPGIVNGSQFYWMFSYDQGFIRRAFIGTLVRPFLRQSTFDAVAPWIVAAHIVACLGVIAVWIALFRQAIHHEDSGMSRLTLAFALLVLMCSEWLPTLAHDVGYVDVYIVSLALVGFWLVLRERYITAALVTLAGPLAHEAFVFLWAPVAVLLVWSCVWQRTSVVRRLAAAAVPALTTAAVAFFQSPAAAEREIDALPLDANIKGGLQTYEIGQTFQSSLHEMMTRQYPGNVAHVGVAAVYFLLPSVAILCAAAFCYWRGWQRPWMTLLVLTAATAAPLAILAFAWDLSRFLVWANVAAAMALIAAGVPSLVP